MKRRDCLLLALAVLVAVPLTATSHEEAPEPPFIYATYSKCDLTQQWLADGIVEQGFAPFYNAAVEDGTIMGWGYLAHHTGGPVRRVLYHMAPTTDALLDALVSINEKIDEKHADASTKYSEICNSHSDYIWRYVTGSAGMESPLEARSGASMSVYFTCDSSRESRADELVKETFAEVYNAHVGEGKLSSWSWFEHWVGGKWRRLMTMTAADAKTLLNVRSDIISTLDESQGEAFSEFDTICGTHDDYLWEIVVENP